MKSIYDKYMKEVEKYYSKNYKKYHTIYHIQRLFEIYFKFREEFLKEFPDLNEDDLFEAIAWHDAVYIVGGEYNEEFSGYLYSSQMLKKGKIPNLNIYDAILSTKIGAEIFNDIEKVLHDLDWNSFAGYYHDFKKDTEKILFEATYDNMYTEKQVKKNMLNFYESIVNKDIYVTKTFSKGNEIAKKNLELKIKELKEELKEMS